MIISAKMPLFAWWIVDSDRMILGMLDIRSSKLAWHIDCEAEERYSSLRLSKAYSCLSSPESTSVCGGSL